MHRVVVATVVMGALVGPAPPTAALEGSVAQPTVRPTAGSLPSAPARRPSVRVLAGAALRIDVNPNLGSRSWKVTVQRRENSRWIPWRTARTRGKREILRLSPPTGRYRVVVHRRAGFAGAVSRVVRMLDRPGMSPATDLSASVTATTASLTWSNPPGTARVAVRRMHGDRPPQRLGTGQSVPASSVVATSVTDAGLSSDTLYSYSVFAISSGGFVAAPVSVTVRTSADQRSPTDTPVPTPPGGSAPTEPPVQQSPTGVWLTTADRANTLRRQDLPATESGQAGGTVIRLDPGTRFQEFEGAGAAVTESSAWLLRERLDPEVRDRVVRDLFTRTGDGIGLNYVRVPMGASDFALGDYTYDDLLAGQTDPGLAKFSISRDETYVLPVLRSAKAVNGDLRVMGSPWSAPAWMKTSGRLEGGSLLPAHRQAYADYFVKFLKAYAAAGVPVHTVTPQNEPMHQTSSYPSMGMSSSEQAVFIRDHLGPALKGAGLSTKILALDHNWDLTDYAKGVLADPAVREYVEGTAFHCYAGTPDQQSLVHAAHPGEAVWMTECSGGGWSTDFGANMGWNIQNLVIGNFRNWGRTLMLWNLALDPDGGPTNGGCTDCRGVVTVDQGSRTVRYNEEYYVLGHVTKVLDRGARRIQSTAFGTGGPQNVAFRNPDGTLALIVHATKASTFAVQVGDRFFRYTLPAGGTASFRWRDDGPPGTVKPPHAGGVLQDFEREGSYYEDFQVRAGLSTGVVHSGSSALEAVGDSGTWHTVGAHLQGAPIDASRLTRICLWVNDRSGRTGNTVGLRLTDASGASAERWSDHAAVGTNPTTSASQWVHLCYRLDAYSGIDVSALERVQMAVYWPGAYYYDDIEAVVG